MEPRTSFCVTLGTIAAGILVSTMFAPMSALAAQPGQPDSVTYVQTAAMSDMFEINSGKLALEKSSNPMSRRSPR